MEGIGNIFIFCILLGTIIFCSGLIIYAVLKWVKDDETRGQRLSHLAILAFIVLFILAFIHWGITISPEDGNGTIYPDNTWFVFSIAFIRMLLIGTIVALVMVLLFIIVACLVNGLRALLEAKSAGKEKSTGTDALAGAEKSTEPSRDESSNDDFYSKVKSPAVARIIAGGIVALFLVIPFLVGEMQDNLLETWKSGVIKIAETFSPDHLREGAAQIDAAEKDAVMAGVARVEAAEMEQNDPGDLTLRALATYALLYIILFGVGLAVVKILHSLIMDSFRKKEEVSLIDTYANPIAFLAVGVSLLWMIQSNEFSNFEGGKLIWQLAKSVGAVMFVAALLILTLEVIRLLLDMREKLIRQEAKYLFISLIGKVVLVLFSVLDSIYNALNNAVGGDENNKLPQIDKKLKKRIIRTMQKAIKQREELPIQFSKQDDNKKIKITFHPFKERVTKK